MNTIRTCPTCGNPPPPDAPAGLCPVCLLATDPGAKPGKGPSGEPASTLTISPEGFTRVRYFGDYQLQEEIARGGMGVVWKARQASLNRTIALKMILAGKLAGEAEVQRFRREAEAAANLQHPNIVAIHEVGEHDGQHYYSMDYVQGRDLGALVRESGPMPPSRAAKCLETIAEAVHFAHQRGTLHRDLKPQNVLMDANGAPRITDFGLAKLVERDDRLTQTGATMGSPSYMPPEQAAGYLDQVGPHSDVYSLGAILYELLTGRPPFRADSAVATMRQVMESDPIPPRKLNLAVPPDLETICLKCLEKNLARRYPSARALAEELGRFLKREPIQAIPASAVRKTESWLRRHPWTLMAVASLVAMVLMGLFYWEYERVKFLEYRSSRANENLGHSGLGKQQLETWLAINSIFYALTVFAWAAFKRRQAQGLRACPRNTGGSATRDFDRSPGGEGRASPKRAVRPEPTKAPVKRPAAEPPVFLRHALRELSGQTAGRTAYSPVSQRMRVGCGLMGVATLGFTTLYFAKIIQVSVWEGTKIYPWVFVYVSFYFSLSLLSLVVRDYQKFVHGAPSRAATAEASLSLELLNEAMSQEIFEGDVISAIQLYRHAIPDASPDEARDHVQRLADELRAKHPEKFSPLELLNINWRLMGVCLVIEAGVYVGLSIVAPPLAPMARLLACAGGFVCGGGVFLATRGKTFWQGSLFLLAMAAALFASLAIAAKVVSSRGGLFFYVLEGFAFGLCALAIGVTRRRCKASPLSKKLDQ